MKNIYLIGGAMGVGKTTACRELKRKLDKSVFLDGDWCWDMDPFVVTEETKKMVTDNICYLLNNFIKCSEYENIIFCWVMHEQYIIDDILGRLNTNGCNVRCISLICGADSLAERLKKDIQKGIRSEDIIQRSLSYLPLYDKLTTEKINISNISPEDAANIIIKG
ncbi:MAG: nucleotide kinase [Anaerofustis stercorihominis]|nr:nucleotide kinase [Anaerofustis stercorihominis]